MHCTVLSNGCNVQDCRLFSVHCPPADFVLSAVVKQGFGAKTTNMAEISGGC